MVSNYARGLSNATIPDLSFERAQPGPVCGVDEAGRGPWAGPVIAAAVILNPNALPLGINDSKKLTATKRESLFEPIKAAAIAWYIAEASVAEIDALNILRANDLAMARAVNGLSVPPASALIDGNRTPPLPCPATALVGGDARSLSVAAASILAKVYRDRLMVAADSLYPGYGFAQHKGYGTAAHAEALQRLGPCPLHRMSFVPLKKLIAQ
jgi:ribonuclease HII